MQAVRITLEIGKDFGTGAGFERLRSPPQQVRVPFDGGKGRSQFVGDESENLVLDGVRRPQPAREFDGGEPGGQPLREVKRGRAISDRERPPFLATAHGHYAVADAFVFHAHDHRRLDR